MRKQAAVLTLVVSAFILASPSPASAAPTECRSWKVNNSREGGGAQCNGGTGHFRAHIYCTANPSSGWGSHHFGAWKLAGRDLYSWAYCPSSAPYVVAAGYATANW